MYSHTKNNLETEMSSEIPRGVQQHYVLSPNISTAVHINYTSKHH